MTIDFFREEVLVSLKSIFTHCPHLNKKEFSYIFSGNLFRSSIAYRVSDFLKVSKEKLLPYLTLIELAHSVSLLQDDIIDGAKHRRGSATAHHIYSPKNTLFLAIYVLSKGILNFISNASYKDEFLQLFAKSIQQVCLGEISQNFSEKSNLSKTLSVAKKKTGELFSLTFYVCSLKKIYSKEFCEISKKIGMLYGLIFQIKDDLQDLLEDQSNKEIYESFPTILLKNIEKKKSTITPTLLLKKKIDQLIVKEKKEIIQEINILSKKEINNAYDLLTLVDEISNSLNYKKNV